MIVTLPSSKLQQTIVAKLSSVLRYIASMIDKRLKASTTTNHVLVLLCAFPLYSRHLLPNEHAHPLDIVSCDPPHVGGPALRSMHTLSRFAMLAATNWSW